MQKFVVLPLIGSARAAHGLGGSIAPEARVARLPHSRRRTSSRGLIWAAAPDRRGAVTITILMRISLNFAVPKRKCRLRRSGRIQSASGWTSFHRIEELE